MFRNAHLSFLHTKCMSGPKDSNLGPTPPPSTIDTDALCLGFVYGTTSKRVNVSRCQWVGSSLYVFGSAVGSCTGVEHGQHKERT